jgi:predicted Holliday junction resolvase-like endonuclease
VSRFVTLVFIITGLVLAAVGFEIGRLQGRLEIEERAEPTVREERDRLLEERDRERERAEGLERELAESHRGFWGRLFGR